MFGIAKLANTAVYICELKGGKTQRAHANRTRQQDTPTGHAISRNKHCHVQQPVTSEKFVGSNPLDSKVEGSFLFTADSVRTSDNEPDCHYVAH